MAFNIKNQEIYSDLEEKVEKNADYYKDKVKTLKKTIKNDKNNQKLNELSLNKTNKNEWTEENYQVINYWLDTLRFNHIINYFYFFKLKKIEGGWAWLLIVLSALSASLSLFQYNEEYYYVSLISKFLLSIFTLFTTLIASWMKKQNYIQRVAELDKYILKTKKIIGSLEADLELPLENRKGFNEFINEYKEKIVEFNSMTPLISPDDWKDTIYILTKYYPEISSNLYPWNKYPEFAVQIMDTYIYNKYNTCLKKIYNCFICQSICCDRRYNSKKLEETIKKMYQTNNQLKPDAIKCGVNECNKQNLLNLLNPKTKIPMLKNNISNLLHNKSKIKKNNINLNMSEYETDTDIETYTHNVKENKKLTMEQIV